MRRRVCSAAGDEQQLQELQAALRTDFLQEVAHTRATQRLNDATQNSDASLQFAWETIQEQKKEVVRLRAENQELKAKKAAASTSAGVRDPSSSSLSSRLLDSSLFTDEPVSAINLLRSQLSSHHETNLSILHDYIKRLEDALRRATSFGDPNPRDSSGITFDSSRGEEKENWRPFFSSSMLARDDFSRTQPTGRRSCEQCKRSSSAMVALQSEVKQLRAQVAADEESLVRAENDQLHLKRENSTLTGALLSAKQQQEELRQRVLDVTHEKHQVQSQREADRRVSERTVRLLQDELDGFDERNKRQARKLERLELEIGNDDRKQRSFSASRRSAGIEDYESAAETNGVLRERISRLQGEIHEFEALAQVDRRVVDELRSTVAALKRENASQGLQEKDSALSAMKAMISSLEAEIESCRQQHTPLESQVNSLQSALSVRDIELTQRDAVIAELKQDKQVLMSLQKVEREKSARHQDALEGECASLGERAEAAMAACEELRERVETERSHAESVTKRLRDAELAIRKLKDVNASLKRDVEDAESRREGLEERASAQAELQLEIERIKSSNATQTQELESANERLSQEIADSKTTILMWMSKYNALSEQVKRLEEDVHCASEDRFSLQRQIESMTADHKHHLQDERRKLEAKRSQELATLRENAESELQRAKQTLTTQFEAKIAALEKRNHEQQLHEQTLQSDRSRSSSSNSGELAQLRASTLDLESQVTVLKDANRGLQFELRSEERQRKTLGFLVETLQERPVLQRRAFQEMLASNQRQLEFVFMQLFARVDQTGKRLLRTQRKCEALISQASRRRLVLRLELAAASARVTTTSSQMLGGRSSHQDTASAVEPSTRDTMRMIEHLAERSQCEALMQVSRVGSDQDVVQRAESILVRALRGLDESLRSESKSAPPASSSAVSECDSAVDTIGSARDSTPTTAKAITTLQDTATQVNGTRQTVNQLKWRLLISAVLQKQQLSRKHQACLRMAKRWMRAANWADDAGRQAISWKWRYLVLGIKSEARHQHHEARTRALAREWSEQLSHATHQWMWKSLALRVEKQSLQKTVRSLQMRDLRHHKLSDEARRQYESKIQGLELEAESLRERSAALSPVSTVALGNCVRLLQKFCDDTDTPADIGASRATLTKYLIESNCKIASWRRTIDRKIEEFSDRKEQLQRLQDRCNEMKDLVALNQRLVRELERKAGSQQAIVDAACAFTRAYKTLRMSVSSQMFKTNEFYSACKRIVEVVHASSTVSVRTASVSTAVSVSASPSAASTPATSSPYRVRRLRTVDEESELTTSQAAASIVSSSSTTSVRAAALVKESNEDVERRRRASRATSEQAVGLLKSANEIREKLEQALAERTAALHHALAQLETKRLQFVVLRSFLRWKFTTYALRMQERQADKC